MDRVRDVVKRLVKRHKTSNPYTIARNKGIIVNQARLKDVLGYHQTYKRQSIICLDESLDEPEKRFVCAHELGHAILHPRLNTPFLRRNTLFSVDKVEREANTFAVELLVDDEAIYSMSDEYITAESVAREHGVPYELIHLKTLV